MKNRSHLVKKQVRRSDGHMTSVWVNPSTDSPSKKRKNRMRQSGRHIQTALRNASKLTERQRAINDLVHIRQSMEVSRKMGTHKLLEESRKEWKELKKKWKIKNKEIRTQ